MSASFDTYRLQLHYDTILFVKLELLLLFPCMQVKLFVACYAMQVDLLLSCVHHVTITPSTTSGMPVARCPGINVIP